MIHDWFELIARFLPLLSILLLLVSFGGTAVFGSKDRLLPEYFISLWLAVLFGLLGAFLTFGMTYMIVDGYYTGRQYFEGAKGGFVFLFFLAVFCFGIGEFFRVLRRTALNVKYLCLREEEQSQSPE